MFKGGSNLSSYIFKIMFQIDWYIFFKRSKHTISWGNWVLKEKPSISLHDSPLKTVLQDSDHCHSSSAA